MERADRAYDCCKRGRGGGLCGKGADRGGQAEGAGRAASEQYGRVEVYTCPAEPHWHWGRMEGIVQGMEYYGDARSAVHGHTIPAVGGHEAVEAGEQCEGQRLRRGKWCVWKYCRCCGGRSDNAIGCAQDEDDAGEKKAGYGAVVGSDIERVWAKSLLCGDGPAGAVDFGWGSDLLR